MIKILHILKWIGLKEMHMVEAIILYKIVEVLGAVLRDLIARNKIPIEETRDNNTTKQIKYITGNTE